MFCPSCHCELPDGFKFCGKCGHDLAKPPATPGGASTTAPLEERREVVILFADVSGFTAMCEGLDPEDVHTIMNEVFAGLGSAVRNEDGHIDKFIGDAVMALFGAPVAHEDDPARACRAAIAMQSFLGEWASQHQARSGTVLRMRIGIHCGLVLAGAIGAEAKMDYSVMGDSVNIAARLESAAPAGGILISSTVADRLGGTFELGAREEHVVKGKSQPLAAFTLLGQRSADAGPVESNQMSFVGRQRELASLGDRLDSGVRWTTVRGETGIGKTRLVEELFARSRRHRPLRINATPATERRPFGLLRQVLYAVCSELTRSDRRPDSLAAFRRALAPLGDELVPFTAALWHVAAPSRLAVSAPDPDPQTLRRTVERGFALMMSALTAHCADLVLVLESFQHADASSAALLASLAGAADTALPPVIACLREDDAAKVASDDALPLGPLARDEAQRGLDSLPFGKSLPSSIAEQILERAGGVPLYMEEIVRNLSAEGLIDDTSATSTPLPSSIRAAMLARIDRLPRSEKDILRECAVQGLEFDIAVAEVVRRSPRWEGPPTEPLLGALERRAIIKAVVEQTTLRAFRQPMMHEACYETLTLRDRRNLHRAIASALAEVAGGDAAVAPEALAHHLERAEDWIEAARANLRAGDRAAAVFLNREALARYEHASTLTRKASGGESDDIAAACHNGAAKVCLRIGRYDQSDEHAQKTLDLTTDEVRRAEARRLSAATFTRTGRDDEANQLLEDALALAKDRSDGVVFQILCDLAELDHRAGRLDDARQHIDECQRLGGTRDDSAAARIEMLSGQVAHTSGHFQEACDHYEYAYQAAVRIGSLSDRARAANAKGNAARDLGDYDLARGQFLTARELWTRIGDTECIAGACNNLGNLAMSIGDLDAAELEHERSRDICARIGNVQGRALAQTNLALLAVERDDAGAAIERAEAALVGLDRAANQVLHSLATVVLGEAHLAAGDIRRAEAAFDTVLDAEREEAHPLAVAGAARGKGRVLLLAGAPLDARPYLDRALETYRQLQRVQEMARTLLHVAEAERQVGDVERARAEARAARQHFVGIGAQRDVVRAEELLAQIDG